MFFCVGLLISILSITHGFLLEQGARNVLKVLRVSNGGQYGYWTTPEYCPAGTFASAYNMRIESAQYFGDDTTLNGIRLSCSDADGHVQREITAGVGPFGSWGKTTTCNQQYHANNYLTAFALQVEKPQGSGDDTSADYVKFYCRDLAGDNAEAVLVRPPGNGVYGSWGEWSESCDNNTAICGLNTKIESVQNDGDDTSLNDAVFYCCDLKTNQQEVVG